MDLTVVGAGGGAGGRVELVGSPPRWAGPPPRRAGRAAHRGGIPLGSAPWHGAATGGTPPRPRRDLRRTLPLVPALALLAVFFAGPVLWCVYAAFTDTALTGSAARNPHFVGLRNFTRLLGDHQFSASVLLTLVFALASGVVGQNALGLSLALLMRGRARWLRTTLGVLLVGAWVLPEIVAGFTLYAFFCDGGTLDTVLASLHLPAPDWLVSHAMLTVVLANVWRGTAFSWMVYTAALDEIPPEIEDATARAARPVCGG